jgi:hypothetical protein
MHAEPIESDILQVIAQYERVTLMVLLENERPWTRVELEREIAGAKGSPGDAASAINNLYAAGLVHISGELVIPSRPARHMDELDAFNI